MKSESMYQEDSIAVFRADRYGHPQRVYVKKLQSIIHGQGLAAPWSDKHGNVIAKTEVKNLLAQEKMLNAT
jgi:hypothetical protein